MKTVQEPITGAEYSGIAATPHLALAQFYAAFNTADLDLMAANWDRTNDVAMDSVLGGLKRGWSDIRSVYETIFASQARVHVELMTIRSISWMRCFMRLGANGAPSQGKVSKAPS